MTARFAVAVLTAALFSTPVLAQKAINKKFEDNAVRREARPSVDSLTAEMLYEFLLAEIASQRDQRDVAAEAYAALARETQDPRIAQRGVEVALASRDPLLAIKATKLWLELEPGSATAQQTLIALLITTEKISEATPYIKNLLTAQPAIAGRIFMQLSGLTAKSSDKQAVLKLMEDLSVNHKDLAEARFATAQAARAAQQPALALSESKAALALHPEWELAVLLHGEVLAQSAPSQAIQFYRDFLVKQPKAREVRTTLARLLAGEKDYVGARKEFEALLTASPETAEYHLALGILSVEMKDYGAAEKYLTRALDLNFRDPDLIRTYLGQINEDQRHFDQAIKWYRQVDSGETYFASQVRVASLMAKQGDITGGVKYLKTIRTTNAEQQDMVVIAHAQILRDAKQYDSALDQLAQGLATNPDSAELLYDRAMTAEKMNKLDLLEADLRRIIVLKPDYAQAYNALGYTLADRNIRLPEALQLIERAYQLDPDDAAILDSLGWVHYRLGNLDKGLAFLRQALSSRPDPEIAAHLAEVLYARGEQAEAKTISEKALRENPGNEALLLMVKKLDIK